MIVFDGMQLIALAAMAVLLIFILLCRFALPLIDKYEKWKK